MAWSLSACSQRCLMKDYHVAQQGGLDFMVAGIQLQPNKKAEARRKAWSTSSPVPIPPEVNEVKGIIDKVTKSSSATGLRSVSADPDFYRLTQNEYKYMSHQVVDAKNMAARKFRGSGFKRFYSDEASRNSSVVYRSQLASSLKAFNNKKSWTPYEDPSTKFIRPNSGKVDVRTAPVRCRPVRPRTAALTGASAAARNQRGGRDQVEARPNTAMGQADHTQLRISPRSSQGSKDSGFCKPPSSNYDTLTPEISYNLSKANVESVYGDRRSSVSGRHEDSSLSDSGESEVSLPVSQTATPAGEDSKVAQKAGTKTATGATESSTSGIGSDNDDEAAAAAPANDDDQESDDDSDDEKIPEPKLDEVEMSRIPALNLRPEQVDNLNILIYPKGDRRKYDFDVDNIEYPPFEFELPLSEHTRNIDFSTVAKDGSDWRNELAEGVPQPDEEESRVIDRIVELEKLQKQTMDFEKGRREQARLAKERAAARSRLGGGRIQCARVWREKKCCVDCLQVLCVGDCNEHKKYSDTVCFLCYEQHTEGTPCHKVVYDGRTRGQAEEPEADASGPPASTTTSRPRSCTSCRRPHTAKFINANNIVLGRPKSSNSTYARGQSSNKPRDLRPPADNQLNPSLEGDFEQLGLEPTQGKVVNKADNDMEAKERPNTACSDRMRHFKGRVGVVPGKSYFSQRRMSLTDRSGRQRMRAATAVKRKKTNKTRPTTAAS